MTSIYLLIFITDMTSIVDVDCSTSHITRTALIERVSTQTGRSLSTNTSYCTVPGRVYARGFENCRLREPCACDR